MCLTRWLKLSIKEEIKIWRVWHVFHVVTKGLNYKKGIEEDFQHTHESRIFERSRRGGWIQRVPNFGDFTKVFTKHTVHTKSCFVYKMFYSIQNTIFCMVFVLNWQIDFLLNNWLVSISEQPQPFNGGFGEKVKIIIIRKVYRPGVHIEKLTTDNTHNQN